jgi:hypothetical protein
LKYSGSILYSSGSPVGLVEGLLIGLRIPTEYASSPVIKEALVGLHIGFE